MPTEGQLMWGTHVYVDRRFNPVLYSLSPVETRILLAQIPALRALDSLYFLQNGGQQNLRLWDAVNAAAHGGNSKIDDYRRRVSTFGGYFGTAGVKFKPEFTADEWAAAGKAGDVPYEELMRDEDAPTGADIFVNETGMSKEQVGKWLQEQSDQITKSLPQASQWAMKHPLLNMSTRSRLVNDENGGIKVVEQPWAEIYPDLIRTAADSLVSAGVIAAPFYPGYTAILNATAVGLEDGNYLLRDALFGRNDSRLYTFAGLTERIGDSLGWGVVMKNAFDGIAAVIDREETANFQKLANMAPQMVMDLPSELRNPNIHPPVMHALRIAYQVGMTAHAGSAFAARKWPNFPVDRITTDTCTYVVNYGDSDIRTRYLLRPTANAILSDSGNLRDEELAEYSSMFDVGHELWHALGLKRIDNSAIEEGRPTAGALWQAERLLGSKEKADRYCKAIFPMLVRFVRGGLNEKGEITGDPHALGTNVLVDMMFENRDAHFYGGKVELNPVGMRKTSGVYCVEGTRLLAGKEQGPMEDFLKPHRIARKETLALIQAMKDAKIPRTFVKEHGTIDEFEARLRAYLPEAERLAATGAL